MRALTVFAVSFSLAVAAGQPASKPAPHAPAATAVLLAPSDLNWTDVKDSPGVKMAVVKGDPNKGAAHFFVKLPAGFSVPLHFHNADHYGTVLSGTMVFVPEGGVEKTLPAGSAMVFTGKKKHTTKCAEGADCVIFVDARSKWDVVPVEKK